MYTFPLIEITADEPYGRGVQYGSQAQELIKSCIAYYRARFEESGQSWQRVIKYARGYAGDLADIMPEVLEEARGIASGAGVDFDDILVVNCRYEITKFQSVPECTTAAIMPAATGGKTYAVKNWDYCPAVMAHVVLLRFRTPSGFSAVGWAEAGQMLREGFNSHGIAMVNNALKSTLDYPGGGVPVTFLRRKVLSSNSFSGACDTVISAPRSVSNNILLVSGEGMALDIEAMPGRCDTISPDENGLLTHANHFVVSPEADKNQYGAKNRDARLHSLLMERCGSIDVPFIMRCMADHMYHPFSICSHPQGGDIRDCDDQITVASMIVDFAENTVHICAGPPCEGEYIAYSL